MSYVTPSAKDDPNARIVVLPDELANQIAAGEVVERPAAAVKELVENSIDAGADRVYVDIEEGGRKLIRITDNGCGMTRGDAQRALMRHATSKLRTTDDLFNIQTLGFRGEALPSIASVSRFTIETHVPGELIGTRVEVEGGKVKDVRDAGIPDGTRIEVRDLFFNTPARLKFLKTTSTEARHISEALLRLALSQPKIHLRLTHNGRKVFDLPSNANLGDRILSVLGKETREALFETAEYPPIDGVRCHGYYSRPDYHQRSTNGFYLFVNGRFVKEKTIQAAVKASYRGMLEKGRYPTVVLFIEIPPDKVDVNVHPTKVDVRFRNSDAIFRSVYHAIHDSLQHTPWVDESSRTYTLNLKKTQVTDPSLQKVEPLNARFQGFQPNLPMGQHRKPGEPARMPIADLFGGKKPSQPTPAPTKLNHQTPNHPTPNHQPASFSSPSSLPTLSSTTQPAPTFTPREEQPPTLVTPEPREELAQDASASLAAPAPETTEENTGRIIQIGMTEEEGAREATRESNDGYFSRLHYIGSFKRTYLICSDASGLVIIDQHASHERISFENLRDAYQRRTAQSQALLFPQRLSLDTLRAAAMHEFMDFFEAMGFEIEHFGGNDFALKAVPAILSRARHDRLIQDTLDDLSTVGRSERIDEAIDSILLRMACHGSIRAGDDMTPEEVRALFKQLDEIDFGANCPHGRPVYYRLPLAELEGAFGR